MRYDIKAKDGTILAEGLNMDALTTFILNNTDKAGKYDIIPAAKAQNEDDETEDEKKERLKQAFINTLTPAQYNDMHLGYKELFYTKRHGWVLKVKDTQKAGQYTPITVIRERESKRRKDILNSINIFHLEIYDKFISVSEDNEKVTFDDFVKYFDKLCIKE